MADFEAPLSKLQQQIEELEKWPGDREKEREASRLRQELDTLRREVFANLTPWQKTMVARHPNRPYTLDYARTLFTDWTEVRGDRHFADDPALVCGFGLFHGRPVCVAFSSAARAGSTCPRLYRAMPFQCHASWAVGSALRAASAGAITLANSLRSPAATASLSARAAA